jgi:hypothetical protein
MALFLAAPAFADWDLGDPHKMHYPQLPDPLGWDVEIVTTQHETADDWQCSETGSVDDVHFWVSCPGEPTGGPGVCTSLEPNVTSITVTIYSNVPDPDPSDPQTFSMPGNPVWGPRTFDPTLFSWRLIDSPPLEGFADPQQNDWRPDDHYNYYQINIVNIQDPFFQQAGEIYWLSISVTWSTGVHNMGWKSSLDHFEDLAVYRTLAPGNPWEPLIDPASQGLDLAFVITGTPQVPMDSRWTLTALGVLLVAALGLLVLRLRRSRPA